MSNNLFLTSKYEKTSDEILLYLKYFDSSFTRRHSNDFINSVNITISNNYKEIRIEYDDCQIKLNNESKMIFRRGDFSYRHVFPKISKLDNKVYKYLDEEWNFVKKYLHSSTSSIGDFYKEVNSNKLIDLENAKKVGLKIPSTLVTNLKSDVIEFLNNYSLIITKPIHNSHLVFIPTKLTPQMALKLTPLMAPS